MRESSPEVLFPDNTLPLKDLNNNRHFGIADQHIPTQAYLRLAYN